MLSPEVRADASPSSGIWPKRYRDIPGIRLGVSVEVSMIVAHSSCSRGRGQAVVKLAELTDPFLGARRTLPRRRCGQRLDLRACRYV